MGEPARSGRALRATLGLTLLSALGALALATQFPAPWVGPGPTSAHALVADGLWQVSLGLWALLTPLALLRLGDAWVCWARGRGRPARALGPADVAAGIGLALTGVCWAWANAAACLVSRNESVVSAIFSADDLGLTVQPRLTQAQLGVTGTAWQWPVGQPTVELSLTLDGRWASAGLHREVAEPWSATWADPAGKPVVGATLAAALTAELGEEPPPGLAGAIDQAVVAARALTEALRAGRLPASVEQGQPLEQLPVAVAALAAGGAWAEPHRSVGGRVALAMLPQTAASQPAWGLAAGVLAALSPAITVLAARRRGARLPRAKQAGLEQALSPGMAGLAVAKRISPCEHGRCVASGDGQAGQAGHTPGQGS